MRLDPSSDELVVNVESKKSWLSGKCAFEDGNWASTHQPPQTITGGKDFFNTEEAEEFARLCGQLENSSTKLRKMIQNERFEEFLKFRRGTDRAPDKTGAGAQIATTHQPDTRNMYGVTEECIQAATCKQIYRCASVMDEEEEIQKYEVVDHTLSNSSTHQVFTSTHSTIRSSKKHTRDSMIETQYEGSSPRDAPSIETNKKLLGLETSPANSDLAQDQVDISKRSPRPYAFKNSELVLDKVGLVPAKSSKDSTSDPALHSSRAASNYSRVEKSNISPDDRYQRLERGSPTYKPSYRRSYTADLEQYKALRTPTTIPRQPSSLSPAPEPVPLHDTTNPAAHSYPFDIRRRPTTAASTSHVPIARDFCSVPSHQIANQHSVPNPEPHQNIKPSSEDPVPSTHYNQPRIPTPTTGTSNSPSYIPGGKQGTTSKANSRGAWTRKRPHHKSASAVEQQKQREHNPAPFVPKNPDPVGPPGIQTTTRMTALKFLSTVERSRLIEREQRDALARWNRASGQVDACAGN